MPVTCAEIEERVLEACYDLETQEYSNIAATARKYDAPKTRVYRRWMRLLRSRIEVGGTNKTLDDAAEQALCLYIEFADDLGISIQEKSLTKAANSILRNHHSEEDPPRVVSTMWASRWFKRHPEYRKKSLKSLAASRKNTHDCEGIRRWFDKLLAVKQQYNILDTDIHNMDETGFRIGVDRQHKIIIRAGNTRRYLVDSDNRDYITFIESISAADESHAPMLVLKASTLLEK